MPSLLGRAGGTILLVVAFEGSSGFMVGGTTLFGEARTDLAGVVPDFVGDSSRREVGDFLYF